MKNPPFVPVGSAGERSGLARRVPYGSAGQSPDRHRKKDLITILCPPILDGFVTDAEAMKSFSYGNRKTGFFDGGKAQICPRVELHG